MGHAFTGNVFTVLAGCNRLRELQKLSSTLLTRTSFFGRGGASDFLSVCPMKLRSKYLDDVDGEL